MLCYGNLPVNHLLPVALYSAPIAGSGQGSPVSLVGTVGCSSPSIVKDGQVLKKTNVIKQEFIFCTSWQKFNT